MGGGGGPLHSTRSSRILILTKRTTKEKEPPSRPFVEILAESRRGPSGLVDSRKTELVKTKGATARFRV